MNAAARPGAVTRARFVRVVALGAVFAAVCVAVALAVGAERIDVLALLSGGGTSVERDIFFAVRLPRVVAGALIGGGLAASGTAFQSLLRNPLAEPYLLGISGGGSLGAVMAIVAFGVGGGAVLGIRAGAALAGCLGALVVVHAIATRGGALHPASLLLAGVVANSFFLAALACVQYAANPAESQAILRWVMGGLDAVGVRETVLLAVSVPLGVALTWTQAASLHALAFGEETAQGLGVDAARVRSRTFVYASATTAAGVAVAGPIGFVGLVVPHAVRRFTGSDPRLLIPAAALAGAGFLPLADAVARAVLAPREIPVGIVSALVGAPLFVVLFLRRAETVR